MDYKAAEHRLQFYFPVKSISIVTAIHITVITSSTIVKIFDSFLCRCVIMPKYFTCKTWLQVLFPLMAVAKR